MADVKTIFASPVLRFRYAILLQESALIGGPMIDGGAKCAGRKWFGPLDARERPRTGSVDPAGSSADEPDAKSIGQSQESRDPHLAPTWRPALPDPKLTLVLRWGRS